MKLPNGGAKIMLERKNGLFFLPVYKADAKKASSLLSLSPVSAAAMAAERVYTDANADAANNEEHDEPQSDPFWDRVSTVPAQTHVVNQPILPSAFRAAAVQRGISSYCLASFELWHQRLRHTTPSLMEQYRNMGIKGFDVAGNKHERKCDCTICRLVKSRAKGQNRVTRSDPLTRVGQRVSSDLKQLPFKCIGGVKWVLPFVDNYTIARSR